MPTDPAVVDIDRTPRGGPGYRPERQDQHRQAKHCGGGVLQELRTDWEKC